MFNYKASEKQAIFHKDKAKFRLYGGSVRSGKSIAICMEAVKQSLKYYKNRGLIARKTFQDLRKTTMETFLRFVPPELIKNHNKAEAKITFHNDSEIQFSDLEDPNKIKSMDLGWFAVDECSDITFDDWKMLKLKFELHISALKEKIGKKLEKDL